MSVHACRDREKSIGADSTAVGVGSAIMRLTYLFVMAVLLIWVPSLLLKFDPRFHGLSIVIDLGCTLAVVVSALSALFTRKWKALATFSMLLTVLIVGVCASFAYRLNNVCSRGDRIIESEADAIKQA